MLPPAAWKRSGIGRLRDGWRKSQGSHPKPAPLSAAEIGYFLTMELEDEYQSLLEHGKALSESEQARLRELEQMKRTGSCGRAQ